MAPLSDFELRERRTFLGGTDMTALAGVNRWATPADVFAEKRPDVWPPKERTTNPRMAMGHLIEPIVAGLAADALGLVIRQPSLISRKVVVDGEGLIGQTRTRRCKAHPWEGASVDRYADQWETDGLPTAGIIECKWGESSSRWSDMLDDRGAPLWAMTPARPPQVPEDYYVQVQHYLHVTGRQWAVLAVLLGYADFRWYRIDPDPDLSPMLIDLARTWWHDHVVPGVPPPPDGSTGYTARLRSHLTVDDGTQRAATLREQEVLREYRAASDDLATAQVRIERARQSLMTSMGSASRIDADGASITWRQNKPSTKIDWQATATALAMQYAGSMAALGHDLGGLPVDTWGDQRLAKSAADHTTTSEGARPFRVTFSDEEA